MPDVCEIAHLLSPRVTTLVREQIVRVRHVVQFSQNGTRPSLDNFAHGAVHELVSPPTTEQEVLPRATAVTLQFTTPPLPSIFLFS